MRTRTRHLDHGTLRRLLDEPEGVLDTDRTHVADCPTCLAGLAAARDDAELAAAALPAAPTDGTEDVDAAWQRLSAGLTRPVATAAPDAAQPRPATVTRLHPHAPRRRRGLRGALRSPVLAGVGVAAVLTGASAAAAGDWIQVFRTEQVAVPDVTRAELVSLPEPEELDGYGSLEVLAEPEVRQVDDAAAATSASGLPVPTVGELPRGVTADPTYQVLEPVAAEFTFDADEARRTVAGAGEELPPPPDGLDGATFRLSAGPGHAALWPSGTGAPALVVGRAVAPTVHSSGVSYETAVDYLGGVPGVPAELLGRLDRFADGTTLPLPFTTDEVATRVADVGGTEATVITSRDGTMSAVVWVEDGVVTAVAGSLDDDEVLAVARGLQEP